MANIKPMILFAQAPFSFTFKYKPMQIKDLIESPENPRLITESERRALGESLTTFGDSGGVIYNRRSKQVVGGCQRAGFFKSLDPDSEIILEEEYDTPNAQGTVARGYFIVKGEKYSFRVVDWDDKNEKIAMIAANASGGGWDVDKLKIILSDLANKVDDISELTATCFDYSILEDYLLNKQDLGRLITAGVLYKNEKNVVMVDAGGVDPNVIKDMVIKTHSYADEPEIDENIKTDKLCPKCGYAF